MSGRRGREGGSKRGANDAEAAEAERVVAAFAVASIVRSTEMTVDSPWESTLGDKDFKTRISTPMPSAPSSRIRKK